MIQYVLEVITFQVVFLIIYDLFLKRETFFQWNRFYLIGTHVLSLVIPWIKIEAMRTKVPLEFQHYPEFLWNMNNASLDLTATQESGFNIAWEYLVLFGGMSLATIFFSYKLYQIWQLKRNGDIQHFTEFTQVIVANSSLAFSFFRSIFLGDKVFEKEYQNIVQHELVHIRQKHSYDLLFFEFMRIVGWFNPLVYVYQNRMSELHEFIADAQMAKTSKKAQYQFLLSHVFETQHISFINQFFKSSLIKKRIVMLQKSQSKRIWQLKYLLLVPIILGMLFYSSCESELVDKASRPLEITVADVENLKVGEERVLLEKLLSFSGEKTLSDIILSDNQTTITFSQIKNGSFISGPNGELIQAKMIIDSKVLDEDFSLFRNKINELESLIDKDLVPFAVIDEIPVFPGCEDEMNKRACFQEMMQKHVSKNFRYPVEAQNQRIQGRVSTMFVITKDGLVRGLKMRGPHKLLEDEVARIISRLPKMTAGKQEGETVNVPFSIPITFKLK